MSAQLFDDAARALRRERALRRQPRPFLAERIVEELVARLQVVQRRFSSALVVGCPPALHSELEAVAKRVSFADSLDALADQAQNSFDLLLTIGELDVRDELPLLLRVVQTRLSPGALFAGAFAGGNGLPALRTALHAAGGVSGGFAPRIHPRIEAGAFAGLLADAGFAEPVVDIDRVRLRYRSLARLVADLRDHGATSILHARPRGPMPRPALRAAEQAFADFGRDGATVEIVELIHFAAWATAPNNRP